MQDMPCPVNDFSMHRGSKADMPICSVSGDRLGRPPVLPNHQCQSSSPRSVWMKLSWPL